MPQSNLGTPPLHHNRLSFHCGQDIEFRLQLLNLLFQLRLQRRVGTRVQGFTPQQQAVQFMLFSFELNAEQLNSVLRCCVFYV